MKLTGTLLLACALATGVAVAQDSTTTPATTSSQSTAKQDMKDVGHATKKTTKKVVHKSAEKTDEGATKVESKTSPQQ